MPIFSDTSPAAEKIQLDLLRQAPTWRKIEMVGQMNDTVRTLALSGLRRRYPTAPPDLIWRYLADQLLGTELAAKVYGPRPETE